MNVRWSTAGTRRAQYILLWKKKKLSAKIWYEGQRSILYSWSEWQTKLLNVFPCEQNYGQPLKGILKRKSRINESIQDYLYENLSLPNQCDISGRRAVDGDNHDIFEYLMN